MITYIACKKCDYRASKNSKPYMGELFWHFFKHLVIYVNSNDLKTITEV
jgi:hypothetical protein